MNAEFTDCAPTRDLEPYNRVVLEPSLKPVPSACYLYVQAEHGAHHLIEVRAFDEAETMAAFQALHAASPKSPITLFFTLDKPFQKATLSLKNEAREIPLTKTVVKVFNQK